MSRLTRDGTADSEPVSRDQILRREGDREMIIFPAQLTTSRIDNLTRLIYTLLYVMTIHTCVPHSHAQTNTHVRSCPGPVRVLYTRVPHSHAHIHTPVRPYVHGHRNPRVVRSQMGKTSDTRGTARTFSANTTPSPDVYSAPTRASQPITHPQRALSPRATSVVNPDTSSTTAPTRTLRQTTAVVPG